MNDFLLPSDAQNRLTNQARLYWYMTLTFARTPPVAKKSATAKWVRPRYSDRDSQMRSSVDSAIVCFSRISLARTYVKGGYAQTKATIRSTVTGREPAALHIFSQILC